MSESTKKYGPILCLRPRNKEWPDRLKKVAEAASKIKGSKVTVTDIINDLLEENLPRYERDLGVPPAT